MNDPLVTMFRALFSLLAWIVILAGFLVGVWGAFLQPDQTLRPIGWAVLVLGAPIAILSFGTVALLIQNNHYLNEIRRLLENQKSREGRTSTLESAPQRRMDPKLTR